MLRETPVVLKRFGINSPFGQLEFRLL